MPRTTIRAAARLLMLTTLLAASHAQGEPVDDLASMSLEQLGDVVITSVSRQEERLGNAAAAVYIISSSDIVRSGARSLPEVLRLAPNLQVARTDARNYAITARGFNSVFENKLLVLIDGRSIYSPLTSGVYWDAPDLILADIERIEVISGPGATIYGANAVNGVINITTKSSKDTQGGRLAAIAGNDDRTGAIRYGGALPNHGHYRVYAKAISVDDTLSVQGVNTETGMHRSQAGFRADWDRDGAGLTLSGDAYKGKLGQAKTIDIDIGGANLTTSYGTRLGNGSDLDVVFIVDHTERDQPNAFSERLNTIDLQVQHNVRLGERHRVSWGGGYRYSLERVVNANAFAFLPGELNLHWGSLFAQDEISLGANLKATAGLKAEHNHYTGLEYMPNLRLAWTPGTASLLWASVARAVRTPSRVDRDLYLPVGAPKYLIGGGPGFVSEIAKVAEFGYRAQPSSTFSYSLTAFYAEYDKLSTLELGKRAVFEYANLGNGTNKGLEAWGRWQAGPHWRLTGGLVVQLIDTSVDPGSRGEAGFAGLANADPKRHWVLRSAHDLSSTQQLDFSLRYNSSLKSPVIPGYTELDVQWLWKVGSDIDIALIGQNLLHGSHVEYGVEKGRSVFERGALLKLVKRF